MSEEKSRKTAFAHGQIPIKELINRTIADLRSIKDRLDDAGRPFNERELELLRITMIPFMRESFDESIFFFASGCMGDAAESVDSIKRMMQSIRDYGG